MPGYDFFMKPKESEIILSVEEVHNTLYSLMLIDHSCDFSGLDTSMAEICKSLSSVQKKRNRLIINGLFYAFIPERSEKDFETYLENLYASAPMVMRNRILSVYSNIFKKKKGYEPDLEEVLQSFDSFISFLQDAFGIDNIDIEIEKEAYDLILSPEKMKKIIIDHLTEMWNSFLKKEWLKNKSVLEESIKAYKLSGIETLSKISAVQNIGCQDMECDWDLFLDKVNKAEKLYLVPSMHLGPYKGKVYHYNSNILWLFYGSLIPEGTVSSVSELSKAELLVYFNAFTDSTRLEILKLCSEEEEFSSIQLMNKLELSQSAASRHLKQLSATGFLKERRENSSKFYKINKDKLNKTIDSLRRYLKLNSDLKNHLQENGGQDDR